MKLCNIKQNERQRIFACTQASLAIYPIIFSFFSYFSFETNEHNESARKLPSSLPFIDGSACNGVERREAKKIDDQLLTT
jgi:hypothetical protein